ncbi:unnamed protein product [Vitrella brassicaformis CCMP3155]|uniref:Uncharacterized protein n=1 Tax=Vitrella brassicaformis (strain CCMP3155) TaxID=1169540 RepID=A0A0G4G4D3_VITBC|nr:unnamed protein product [Vitrella brassicaformis CCMP3155]|mmetsp:Transcript_8062/g.22898  ORF Transcript_8062/g.22898 Transcript_8062/m.22898 type:complete len:113 (-) Transcript_8062:1046-1384(-)|eukprot:CEM23203.1 unnamed protein product [Vitrella brassicaformis CCMP3155]
MNHSDTQPGGVEAPGAAAAAASLHGGAIYGVLGYTMPMPDDLPARSRLLLKEKENGVLDLFLEVWTAQAIKTHFSHRLNGRTKDDVQQAADILFDRYRERRDKAMALHATQA